MNIFSSSDVLSSNRRINQSSMMVNRLQREVDNL
jgi:hypothetical protein